ncbi:MAG: hypothetical protein KU37_09135 [Sulfuricurvum sp. PC08-66]|nr:MAG: hypothetical protein KU37_09135 [Sulfuricurvum sp. PC08-66]
MGLTAWGMDAATIIEKMQANLEGVDTYQRITMTTQTDRSERTMKMESYAQGNDKSFIRITYPKKDQGITFLKREGQMWQYIPKIEKIIKIPASMMMQSWMGSDFSNDDMVRESSMMDDYDATLLESNATHYTLQLIPKEDAPVVWGKIVLSVENKTFVPMHEAFYDEDGVLERVLQFEGVKLIDGHHFPHRMIMLPQSDDKKGNITTIEFEHVDFNPKIDPTMFTQNALKRLSR